MTASPLIAVAGASRWKAERSRPFAFACRSPSGQRSKGRRVAARSSVCAGSGGAPGAALSYAESDADIATINAAILDDQLGGLGMGESATPQPYPGRWGWSRNGILYVPNRGFLATLPGDVIGVDATGWPILLSHAAAVSAGWHNTAT